MVVRTKTLTFISVFLTIAWGAIGLDVRGDELTAHDCWRASALNVRAYLRERRATRQTAPRLRVQFNLRASELTDAPALVFVREIDPQNPLTHRYEFRSTGPSLYSTAGRAEQNPHGSPEWIPLVLSPATSRWLGIEIRADRTVIYPSVTYLNHRLEQLNNLLHSQGRNQRVAVSFYDASGKVTLREYLTRYYQNGQLPASSELIIHDLDYHLAALLIPEDMITHGRAQTEYAVRWMEFVEQKIAAGNFTPAQETALRAAISRIESDLALSVDSGTGNISTHTARGDTPETVVTQMHKTLLRGGASASNRLNNTLDKMILTTFDENARALLTREFSEPLTEFARLRSWLREQSDLFMNGLPAAEQERFRLTRPRRPNEAAEIAARRRTLEAASLVLQSR